jgi:cell division protein FtsZ
MQDELRVTVVATGLGRPAARTVVPAPVLQRPEQPAMRVVRKQAPASAPDYSQLERPAIQRKSAVGDGLSVGFGEGGDDLLDIPAFLRRQAD